MTHPILALQSTLVPALNADAALTALLGADGVFDAPPRDRHPPYVVVARHDVLPRDGDLAPGHEHRLLLHAWARAPSRKAALAIADRVVAVAVSGLLARAPLGVTQSRHPRPGPA